MPRRYVVWVCNCAAILAATLIGCGSAGPTVTGKVTCSGNPVVGSLLFSPVSTKAGTGGEPVPVVLNADGTFTATLSIVGPHRVVILPSDVKYPAPPGKEYPCDLTPRSETFKAGPNELIIELSAKK